MISLLKNSSTQIRAKIEQHRCVSNAKFDFAFEIFRHQNSFQNSHRSSIDGDGKKSGYSQRHCFMK